MGFAVGEIWNIPALWFIICPDTSKTTSSFPGQLEKRLVFTDPKAEAYFEGSDEFSICSSLFLGIEYKMSLSVHHQKKSHADTPRYFNFKQCCSVWHQHQPKFYVPNLMKLFFSSLFLFFFNTTPLSAALFNVKLSIKLLCSGGRESHKSSARSFIHLAQFVIYIKTCSIRHLWAVCSSLRSYF